MMSSSLKILTATVIAGALVATVSLARTVHSRAELTGVQHTISTRSAGTVGYARGGGQPSPERGIIACGSVRLDCDQLEDLLAE